MDYKDILGAKLILASEITNSQTGEVHKGLRKKENQVVELNEPSLAFFVPGLQSMLFGIGPQNPEADVVPGALIDFAGIAQPSY
jgi:hypothetical protein